MPTANIFQSEFTGEQMDERFRAVATLAEALTVLEQAIAAKYTKPADGIPSTDMDASVQSALALALTSVQSLADYYTKSQVDSIAAAIAATVNATSGEVVASLPTASASTLGKIYYVGPTSGEYDRYVTSYDGTTYSWLQIGTTDVDMTQYATKAELNQLAQEVDYTLGQSFTKDMRNASDTYSFGQLDKVIPSGTKIKNTCGVSFSLTNMNSSTAAGYETLTIPSDGSVVTLTFDAPYLRLRGTKALITWDAWIESFISEMNTRLAGVEGVASLFASKELEMVTNPARKDGSSSASGSFSGYKVSLSGLYEKGVRRVRFRGSMFAANAAGNTIIPGYIVDTNSAIESMAIAEAGNFTGWFDLPVKATSSYLYASYMKNNTYGAAWTPEVVYFITDSNVAQSKGRASAASLAAGESLTLTDFPNSNHIGNGITFGGKFSSFGTLRLSLGYNSSYAAWLEIDDTYIKLFLGTDTSTPVDTQEHGLTLSTMVNVNIRVIDEGGAEVSIQTLAGYYQHTFAGWDRNRSGSVMASLVGMSMTECELSADNPYFNADLWIFGASFESWGYWWQHISGMGYKHYFINAYPGRASEEAFNDFKRALNFGKPKYLLWTIFGNDSTDSKFADYLKTIAGMCKTLGIVPIFSLRPDTPTVDYAARRAAVIATGERYVDLVSALQKTAYADGGEWYDGFLSNDGKHPTAAGSRAIAMQILKDVPEIKR